MPKRILAGMILSLLTSTIVFAGWTSGGGEILKDAQNPWFIPYNTPDVKYCIEMDEQNFGATREQVNKAIKLALDFWKVQFQDADNVSMGGGYTLVLAQHNYQQVSCDVKTDLTKDQVADIKFQFGTLNGDQFAYFKNPTSLVASAVRTYYDTKELHAKGFIYVSPENGPLKIQSTNVINNPWSQHNGVLLVPTLIHELGHVFGIPHSSNIFIMREDFPEELLTQKDYINPAEPWVNVVEHNTLNDLHLLKFTGTNFFSSVTACGGSGDSEPIGPNEKRKKRKVKKIRNQLVEEFFGFNFNDYACYGFALKDFKFQLLGYKSDFTNAAVILGQADTKPVDIFAEMEATIYDEDLVRMYFPADQTVFQFDDEFVAMKKVTIARYSSATKLKGNFTSADGKTKRKVLVEVAPLGMIKVGGSMNGELFFDVTAGY